MLHVLRHYLPLRKTLLIASEAVLITLVVTAGSTAHLWNAGEATVRQLANEGLSPTDARWQCFYSALVVALLTQIAISFNELYDFRISGSRYDRAARFLGSAGTGILIVVFAAGLMELWHVERVLDFPGLPFSQTVVLLTASLILAFVLLYFWRNVFHALLRRSRFNERILILGSGRLARRTAEEVRRRSDTGYEIVAMLAGPARDTPRERRAGERRSESRSDPLTESRTGNPWFEASTGTTPPAGPQARIASGGGARTVAPAAKLAVRSGAEVETLVDPAESLPDLAKRLLVDDIVVAFEERRGSLPTDELLRCRLEGIVVEEAEAFYERLTGKIPAEAMRPSYLIFNAGFLQHPLSLVVKRVTDVLLSGLGLLLALPVMVVTAILIRLDSRGPILFRQERTGQNGDPFTLFKFRSMRVDAERETGPVWAQENDPRITRVGRFLRRTRLDELPQLFNVLGGTMSLVGPRPERPSFVAELAEQIPYYHQRHIVKPGLSGWAQINYPYGNTVEDALQKLQYDLFYIKYQSVVFDLSIVFNTLKTVVLGKGT